MESRHVTVLLLKSIVGSQVVASALVVNSNHVGEWKCAAGRHDERSSDGSALACCKAGLSSNIGSAPQGGSAH